MFKRLLLLLVLGLLPLRAGVIMPIFETTHHSMDMEWDMYYTSIDYYLTPFAKTNEETLPLGETAIYRELLSTFLVPHTFILEGSVYPMLLLGSLLKTNAPGVYTNLGIGSFNLLKALSGPWREPWAATIFIGNVLRFKPAATAPVESMLPADFSAFAQAEEERKLGLAYGGLVLSTSSLTVIENVFLDAPWLETQLVIKGKVPTTYKTLFWNFKVGARYTFGGRIDPWVFASFSRDRVDYPSRRVDLVKNTRYELRLEKGLGTNNYWRFGAVVGRNFPFPKSTFALSLSVGVAYTIDNPYDPVATGIPKISGWSFSVMPGMKF